MVKATGEPKIKAPHETGSAGHGQSVRSVAGLSFAYGLGCNHGGCGGGSGGDYGCLGAPFQKFLLAEPIKSGFVTDISRHRNCFLCVSFAFVVACNHLIFSLIGPNAGARDTMDASISWIHSQNRT